MKKAIVLILAICLFSPLSLLAAKPKKGQVTSVVKHGLNIRKKPTTKSKKTGSYMWAGDSFSIKAVSGKWFKTTYKGVTGWVYSGKGYIKVTEYADEEVDVDYLIEDIKKVISKSMQEILKIEKEISR